MKVQLPIKLLKIEGDGFHLSVKVKVNGRSANMIVDTGASKTVFDKKRIGSFIKEEKFSDNEKLSTGLGTNSMQSQTVVLRKLEFGKFRLENYTAVILDLSHVNVTYEKLGLKAVDGVLGSDVFEMFKTVIDFGKRKMMLHSPKARKKK